MSDRQLLNDPIWYLSGNVRTIFIKAQKCSVGLYNSSVELIAADERVVRTISYTDIRRVYSIGSERLAIVTKQGKFCVFFSDPYTNNNASNPKSNTIAAEEIFTRSLRNRGVQVLPRNMYVRRVVTRILMYIAIPILALITFLLYVS